MTTDCYPCAEKISVRLMSIMILWLLCSPLDAAAASPASMTTYCNEPPFAAAGIGANLLLMIDNSASMYDLAYSNPSTYCLDDSYDNAKSYGGYFQPGVIYKYDLVANEFAPGFNLQTPPCSASDHGCTASTSYLYVRMADPVPPATDRKVSVFKATGNFLNWLAMSKLDLEKQVLTGGKYLSGKLQGETRGCQGKRFVKIAPEARQITFAVRGPASTDAGYQFDTSRGGGTRIEIYDKAYNKTACLGAVQAWLAKDKGELIAQANQCMDVKEENYPPPSEGKMPSAGMVFNQAMTDCYVYLVEKIPMTVDAVLQKQCMDRYHGIFGYQQSLDWNALDGICSNKMRHSPRVAGPFIDISGYIGRCADLLNSGWSDPCTKAETIDYCNEIANPWLTDPPTIANMTKTNANIPGFILDAGISNLGKISGTFDLRVHLGSAPTGLIQEFGNSINFGAMVFNANGAAGSECDAGKLPCVKHCSLNSNIECTKDSDCTSFGTCEPGSDGGRIISYINDPASPLGDHGTGLIAAIDGVTASAWTPFAESFYNAIGYYANRSDLRLQSADFDTVTKPAPSLYTCQRNHILIVSDGMSTADSNPAVEALASLYGEARGANTGTDSANACPGYEGSRSLDDLAWIAAHRNIRRFTTAAPVYTDPPRTQRQSITTSVIFTGSSNGAPGECDPETLMKRTAAAGGGVYARSADPSELSGSFRAVLRQIAEGTNSGTDASILASGNGNGAVFLHEQYYPKKSFDAGETSAAWVGEMQGLWYFIDPFIGNSTGTGSTIREDSDSDLMLSQKNDQVVQFQDTTASLFFDADGDGNSDGVTRTIAPDAVKALWRAGIALWHRSSADRTIYTQTDGAALTGFSSLDTDDPKVVQLLQARDGGEAKQIISYVKGTDDASLRSRTVTIPSGSVAGVEEGTGVWKLGDIISSTPKVQSSTALNGYHLPAPGGYGDVSYHSFINSSEYRNRGTVYVGANDGMLHAFHLGRVLSEPSQDAKGDLKGDLKAKLEPGAGAELGREQWAFIPRNALPYLTYLKEPDYQHLYYVDGGITLADVSIGDTGSAPCVKGSYWSCPKPRLEKVVQEDNTLDPAKNTWRTVLIGGMGLGGASCEAAADECVPTPILDPSDPTRRLGYSSYFALDVTDPDRPALLWEFSHPDLGYSTTGPAIVRVGDPELNGRWFAVFGSGPSGPIVNGQFLGHSDKELKFFVVDLRSGQLISTIATGIPNAFAGSLSGGAIDDRWKLPVKGTLGKQEKREIYQDDAIYAGYVALDPVQKTWTKGGVGRIMIEEVDKEVDKKDPDAPALAPTDDVVSAIWHWSRIIGYHPQAAPGDGTGPVTTSIARLLDKKPNHQGLWLYFGTGRYYYRSTEQDDWSGLRSIYGIKEPCYLGKGNESYLDKYCSDPVCSGPPSAACIADQSSSIANVLKGWRIGLDAAQGANGAERLITNPVSITGGAVFFTTFQPSSVPCQVGNSYLWGVRYDTGGTIPEGSLRGKILVQLSSGRVREIGLATGLTDKDKRRGPAIPGSKPGGMKVITNSGLKPLKKIIHIQER